MNFRTLSRISSTRPISPDADSLVPEDDNRDGSKNNGRDILPRGCHGELDHIRDEHGGHEDGVEQEPGEHDTTEGHEMPEHPYLHLPHEPVVPQLALN